MYGTVPAWPQGFGTEHMIGNRNLSSVEIGINHTLQSRCELFISGNVRKYCFFFSFAQNCFAFVLNIFASRET